MGCILKQYSALIQFMKAPLPISLTKEHLSALQYGVEGFVSTRHMVKQDGTTLKWMKNCLSR
jgi:hypothetical protein